jgi:aminoglycoside phosphotransferase (APT) family kinase protein
MEDLKRFKDLPNYSDLLNITQIHKGWSLDKKYHVLTKSYGHYLLRTSAFSQYDKKKSEYEFIQTLAKEPIPMSQPIDFGVFNEGQEVYMLLSFIDGEQAEIVVPHLPKTMQYELGFEAGKILKQIHSINVADPIDFNLTYKEKIARRIESFKQCEIKNEKVDEIIQWVQANTDLLNDRPISLQHGDYHTGNMIINQNNDLSIIDFNRHEIADPYYEFNRLYITIKYSEAFASGQINGYFNNEVPEDFFTYLKFYVLSTQIGVIPWALVYDKDNLEFSYEGINQAYHDFIENKSNIPSWYITVEEAKKL